MTKTKIGAQKEKRSQHNLSCTNITTTDLFKIQPVFAREILKSDKFSIRTAQINRVDALPVSSFVEINNRHDWFYVKYNQVWKPFDSFKSRTPYAFDYQNTVPSKVPYITVQELFCIFCLSVLTVDGTSVSLTENIYASEGYYLPSTIANCQRAESDYNLHKFDFMYVGPASWISNPSNPPAQDTYGIYAFRLTPLGRLVYSILYTLGYRIPSRYIVTVDNVATSEEHSRVEQYIGLDNSDQFFSIEMNALPLMSYLSILVNYYVPTKFRNYQFINSLSYLVNPIPHPYSSISVMGNIAWDSNVLYFYNNVIKVLLSIYYGSDYFTDSLQQPFLDAVGSMYDPATDPNFKTYNTANEHVSEPSYSGKEPTLMTSSELTVQNNYAATQYLLTALSAATSKAQIRALTKNNLIGSMLQQFGVKPESADMIPYNLSTHKANIVVSPEISTAATELAPLGFKAGNGHGESIFKDEFEFDNYGTLICVNCVSPEISFVDGLHREMVHTGRQDFFDPAYVNLGYQAIANFELTLSPKTQAATQVAPRQEFPLRNVFGFQNKYAEYGYKRDFAGGDFVINSINAGLDAFHFFRRFDDVPARELQNNELFASPKMLTKVDYDAYVDYLLAFKSQYDRIFAVDDANYDHIQQWTQFQITAWRDIADNGEFQIGEAERIVEGKSVTDNLN